MNSYPSGNRVFVNRKTQADGKIMTVEYASKHIEELGFPDVTEEARKLLREALDPVVKELDQNFDKAVAKYDPMSLNYYLSQELNWSAQKINYVEVMCSQTNEFQKGLVDAAILNEDFTHDKDDDTDWMTIANGMNRLPEAMANYIGRENIVLQAAVNTVVNLKDGHVKIGYNDESNLYHEEEFDAVILALPPSPVYMIPNRPSDWPVDLERGLRSIHFQPIYKLGLRFKTRFWEREDLCPSNGGCSITDLPSRWVVYPSYASGSKGPGVLVTNSSMTDSSHWLPKSKQEKVVIALKDLQKLYPEVDIFEEFAGGSDPNSVSFLDEAFTVQWGVESTPSDASFYPGQFTSLYKAMNGSQGNVYFAGEHLSTYHGWIAGALDSALKTFNLFVAEQFQGKNEQEYVHISP